MGVGVLRALLEQLSDEARQHALAHPAFTLAHGDSYERLEFLGDAVLGSAIAAELYERFPEGDEGVLSRIKAAAVSRTACAIVARENELGVAMASASPTDAAPGLVSDLSQHERVLAALTESVIGSAFLELGYEAVAPVIVAAFDDQITLATGLSSDSKSDLQEHAQRQGDTVGYELVEAVGPDHDRIFTMEARLVNQGTAARGEGRTKKAAEQLAASRLLELIGGEDDARGGTLSSSSGGGVA